MIVTSVKPVLFIGLILLLAGTIIGQPAQSHPLSQIVPIDTDLNMSENSIENVSKLVFDQGTEPEGLLIDDLTITHQGRAQKLILDYNNNEWRIESSNLSMQSNDILTSGLVDGVNIGSPGNALIIDGANSYGVESSSLTMEEMDNTSLNDKYLNRATDFMKGNLGMNGSNINNIDTLNNFEGKTLHTGGDISIGSGTVTSTSEMCIGNEC